MIGVTATVVANRTTLFSGNCGKVADEFADGFILQISACDGVVQLRDVSIVVLVVMDFHGACVEMWFERVVRVRK